MCLACTRTCQCLLGQEGFPQPNLLPLNNACACRWTTPDRLIPPSHSRLPQRSSFRNAGNRDDLHIGLLGPDRLVDAVAPSDEYNHSAGPNQSCPLTWWGSLKRYEAIDQSALGSGLRVCCTYAGFYLWSTKMPHAVQAEITHLMVPTRAWRQRRAHSHICPGDARCKTWIAILHTELIIIHNSLSGLDNDWITASCTFACIDPDPLQAKCPKPTYLLQQRSGAPMTETLLFPIVLPAIPNFRQRQGNQLRVLINQNAALSGWVCVLANIHVVSLPLQILLL